LAVENTTTTINNSTDIKKYVNFLNIIV